MENKRKQLFEKLEAAREKFAEKIADLRPSSWSLSDDLYDILDEVVDDIEYYGDEACELDRIEAKIEECTTEDDFEEIERDIMNIEDDIDNLTIDDDLVIEKINDHFIYYDDAWDYLKNQDIVDFEEAIALGGFHNICGIATYYLMEEYWGY